VDLVLGSGILLRDFVGSDTFSTSLRNWLQLSNIS
jgi:hypothetical protein